jgi:HEPN domain-containing protein
MSDLDEAKRWLAQAALDLQTAMDNIEMHPYAACFFSQQAAEKATKSFPIAEAGDYKRSHDILGNLKSSQALQDLIALQDATLLDSFYISTRYPDAWPGGIPGERYSVEQARQAVEKASGIVAVCTHLLAELEAQSSENVSDEG